jgi:hypothetical protein
MIDFDHIACLPITREMAERDLALFEEALVDAPAEARPALEERIARQREMLNRSEAGGG